MKTSIQLYNGEYFDYNDIENSPIRIENIAAGLSKICRYSGQCNKFYSVAEHSVYVSWLSTNEERAGLLHDSPEHVVLDVVKPFKITPEMAGYRTIEDKVERRCAEVLGIPYPLPEIVHWADMTVLKAEKKVLFDNHEAHYWSGLDKYPDVDIEIACLPPAAAERFFLDRFYELSYGNKERSNPKSFL